MRSIEGIAAHMGRAGRVLATVIVLLLAANAGAMALHETVSDVREADGALARPPATEVPAAAPPSVAATTPVVPAPGPHKQGVPPTTAPAKTRGGPPSAAAELFPLLAEGYAYDVELTPTCGRPGDLFTATLRLKPKWGSAGSFMVLYADGSYEDPKGQVAEPDGAVRYTWMAKPVPGEGRLVTQARDADTAQSGTKVLAFRLVDGGQSC